MNGGRPDEVPIIMILVAAMFLLASVGLALYLYVSGVRPFRFAFYILVFFFALTVGIGLIQHFYEGCCAPLQMWTGS